MSLFLKKKKKKKIFLFHIYYNLENQTLIAILYILKNTRFFYFANIYRPNHSSIQKKKDDGNSTRKGT